MMIRNLTRFLLFATLLFPPLLNAGEANRNIPGAVVPPVDGQITVQERFFLISFLERTERDLIATLEEMSPEAWRFRPADGGWTPEECVNHLLLAERGLFGQINKALAAPAKSDLSTRDEDAWLIAKVSDRGNKVKTPLPMKIQFDNPKAAIAALKTIRAEIAVFLSNEELPLRNHFGRSPYGPADAYQLFLVISAHTMRHHHQLLAVLKEKPE